MNKEKKLVSIVLINWNSFEFTKKCIENIRKTTLYPNYDVWLVDNGSTDGSLEKLVKKFGFLKTIRNRKNMGFAYALNQGYKNSQGDFVGYVGSDAVVLEGWMQELVSVLEESPEIGVVGAREVSKLVAQDKRELDKIKNQPNVEKMTLPVCWLVKRSLIKKIGFLDAEFFSPAYGEEADWNFRARKLGYKIIRVSRSNVIHFGSAVIREKLGDKKYFTLINYHRLRSMLFNLSLFDLLRFVPGLGLIFLNSFFNGSFPELIRSYWFNAKDWKLILEQRKAKRRFIPFKKPVFTVID